MAGVAAEVAIGVAPGLVGAGVAAGLVGAEVATGVAAGLVGAGVATGVAAGLVGTEVATGVAAGLVGVGVASGLVGAGVASGVAAGLVGAGVATGVAAGVALGVVVATGAGAGAETGAGAKPLHSVSGMTACMVPVIACRQSGQDCMHSSNVDMSALHCRSNSYTCEQTDSVNAFIPGQLLTRLMHAAGVHGQMEGMVSGEEGGSLGTLLKATQSAKICSPCKQQNALSSALTHNVFGPCTVVYTPKHDGTKCQ